MRVMDPAVKAVLAQPHYEYLMFHLGGVSNWYFTTAPFDIPHDGNIYMASGLLIDGKPIKENADLESGETEFTFLDDNRVLSNVLLYEGYINRPVTAEYALFNLQAEFVGTMPFFIGNTTNIDRASLDAADSPPLTIQCQWIWSVGGTPAGRNCSSGAQKAFFPNDLGFDFINDLGKELPWGRE